jgi:hypothetical protein
MRGSARSSEHAHFLLSFRDFKRNFFRAARLELADESRAAVELNTARRPASVLMSMNTRNLPVSAFFVAVGAGAVLLIGAFTRFDPASAPRPAAELSPSPPPTARDDPPAEATSGPTLPSDLSPGLAEIIKLAQAHVDEDVILAYVKNSHQVFSPTADEILYLSDLGLSQNVIGAIVKTATPAAPAQSPQEIAAEPAPALAPAPASPPAAPLAAASQPDSAPSAGAFYNDLAPYGTWVQQPDYGLCWQPAVETSDPNWTPYVDAGQWIYSDCGWYWQSDYTWGWAAFHYGRWANVPRHGWVWVPDNQWAPAWVAWRSASSYVGWAPLPPGVSLNVLAQLTYNSKPAGPTSTFGLPHSAYSFINIGSLISRNLPRHLVPAMRVKDLMQKSVLLDSYAIVNKRIFNGGINRDVVAEAAHKAVPEYSLRAVSSPQAAGLAMDRKTLAVYLPSAPSADASRSAPFVVNKSRVQAQTEKSTDREPTVLPENGSADEAVAASPATSDAMWVELPPLRYPYPNGTTAPMVRGHNRNVIIASGVDATPANRDWASGYGTTPVARPATPAPAPRFDAFNPPARQAETSRMPVENRAAPVEPAHAAPAPAAASPSSSSGTAKSGK